MHRPSKLVLDVKESKVSSRQLLASGVGMAGLGRERANNTENTALDKNRGGLTAVVNWRTNDNDLAMDGADLSPQRLGHQDLNLKMASNIQITDD